MPKSKHTTLFFALLLLACACASPDAYEEFIKTTRSNIGEPFVFSLDMSDSTAVYDIWMFSRIDGGGKEMFRYGNFPVIVLWESPSGQRYQEKVWFDIHAFGPGSSRYSNQYMQLYRSSIIPVENGVWTLSLNVQGGQAIPGFRGMGIRCSKQKQ